MKMLIGSLALILVGGLADVSAADPPAKFGVTLEPVADEAELHQLMQKNMAQVQLRHRAMLQLMKQEGDQAGDQVRAKSQNRVQSRDGEGDGAGDQVRTRTQARKQLKQGAAGDGIRSALRTQRQTEDSLEAKLQNQYRHRARTSTGAGMGDGMGGAGSHTQAKKRGR